jgi:hypothetical protein
MQSRNATLDSCIPPYQFRNVSIENWLYISLYALRFVYIARGLVHGSPIYRGIFLSATVSSYTQVVEKLILAVKMILQIVRNPKFQSPIHEKQPLIFWAGWSRKQPFKYDSK